MSWSLKLGRIAGIDVFVHFTFFLLLIWVGISNYQVYGTIAGALAGIFFILLLFGIVVLHELGHALTARRFGIRTRDIILLPIGGVARLERMPDDAKQELLVALAGPAVNVALAAVIYLVLMARGGLAPFDASVGAGVSFLSQLFWVNVWLAGFNLLPAFPMDGGRVLRALLAMRLEYVRATQIAASVGHAMAILFVIAGFLMGNPMLMLIALFVWIGASQEATLVQMRAALGGIPVMRAMIRDFKILHPDDPLEQAVQYVLAGFQQDFPVVEDGQLVGILRRSDLITALSEKGAETPVREVMQREFVTTHPREMLQTAFTRLEECACHTLPVVENGQLVGLITADTVAETLMIQEALRAPSGPKLDRVDGRGRAGRPRAKASWLEGRPASGPPA